MTEKIKEIIVEKILSLVCISLLSGSTSTIVAKRFETRVFGTLSLGVLITIGIIVASVAYFIFQSINARNQRARAEYNKILKDIDDILDLKNYKEIVDSYNERQYRFSIDINDRCEKIKSYEKSRSMFWPKSDKFFELLVIDIINKYSDMWETISKHLVSNPDETIWYIEKFYSKCDDSMREKMEKEYDKYIESLGLCIKNYCDSLNRVVDYVHNKKYDYIGTSWEKRFLMK